MDVGYLEALGVVGVLVAALAFATNLRDFRVGPAPIRILRAWAMLGALLAFGYYLGTLFGLLSPAEHGPIYFRPISILLLAVIAAEPIIRWGREKP